MRKRNRSSRRGFTLLEVLVATAVTLLMMVSLAQAFKIIGDSMKQGRATLQMNNTLRSISFRLRHDLNNLTIRVDPPADSNAGSGYFEYFDGAMTDYTATLFDKNNAPDLKLQTTKIRSSRFGDLDDILMFTSRAGDSWFVGRVPAFVINTSLVGTTTDSDSDGTPDKYEPVMISSQLAEIAVFSRPVLTGNSSNTYFDDVDSNGLPDAYQLHYRALLIRPDLNLTSTTPPRLPNDGTYLVAGGGATYTSMALAHQQCDLSMRRIAGTTQIAANSLDDLMIPANRFAHVQYRVGTTASMTMPLLALQPIPRVALPVFSDDGNGGTVSPFFSDPDPAAAPAGAAGNFLAPEFVLAGERRGEDILANEILAFDVKAFDGGVPVLGMVGADGIAGTTASPVLGAEGSDDVILTPSDPGYVVACQGGSTEVAYGAYVDLLWARKTLCSMPYFGLSSVPATAKLVTELSGLATVNPTTFADGLIRSGKVVLTPKTDPPIILQPTFDTWTTRYENDGALQAQLANLQGVLDIDAYQRNFDNTVPSDTSNLQSFDAYRKNLTDAGSDGIDNNGTGGVDEAAELETLPPFPVKLRGIKVSIRIEDRATRQVRQMSVANEFVTQ